LRIEKCLSLTSLETEQIGNILDNYMRKHAHKHTRATIELIQEVILKTDKAKELKLIY
jgi:hypothetical protein